MINLLEKINYMQRQVIVQSYLYYERDYNVWSDKKYDAFCRKLVALKEEHPDLWIQSEYYKQFKNEYDGTTGFYLYHELDDRQKEIIKVIANYAIKNNL